MEAAASQTVFELLEDRKLLAAVSTDKHDYAFGQTAQITATGFQPGESVEFQVLHAAGTLGSNDDAQNQAWHVADGGAGDLDGVADGNVHTNWIVDDPDAVEATYVLTASGMTSALTAQTMFTDASVTAASGGTNISADRAANATLPQWTTLGTIAVDEANGAGGRDDMAASQTNATLILTAPSGWEFNPGVGSVTFAGGNDITAAAVNVTSTIITLTFSTDSTANSNDSLDIAGIQVRALDGAAIGVSSRIYRATSNPGTAVITPGITTQANGTLTSGTNFGSLSQVAGAAAKLLFTSAAQTIDQNTTSATMTVQRQDQFGSATTTGGTLTLNLTSSSGAGGVFRNSGDTANITSITIASGSSTSGSFRYRDDTPGTYTLTAAESPSAGLVDATQSITILLDDVAPTVTNITPAPASLVAFGGTVTNVDVTFSEAVIGVGASDLVLSGPGSVGATVGAPTNTSGNTWRFPVSNMRAGVTNLTLAPTAGSITDNSGNSLAPVSWHYDRATIYFGIEADSNLPGLSGAQTEDIVKFDGVNFTTFFDGSDVSGLSGRLINAFAIISDTEILMTFTEDINFGGSLGTVNAEDILKFTATSLGSTTAGTLTKFFDGSTNGISAAEENIDSIHLLSDGRLLISTVGDPTVTGLSGLGDEDIIAFTPATAGNYTGTGTWTMYFDGSDVSLTDGNEDIRGVSVHEGSGRIFLTTQDDFGVTGLNGEKQDIFIFTPTSIGATTAGSFSELFRGNDDYTISPGLRDNDIFLPHHAPAGINKTTTVNEDTSYAFTITDFGFSDPNDTPADSLLNVMITTLPTAGTLTLNGGAVTAGQSISAANITAGQLVFTPAANANGTNYASFTFQVQDNGGTANGGEDTDASANTFTFHVTAVNDVPSFVKGANQTSNEDAGAQTVSGWATSISAGPSNESSQLVDFIVTNDNNALFDVQPSIAPDGTLTYTAAANVFGAATVTVRIHDNGGIANGGVDTSAAQTFTITINPVNDAPSFVKGADQTVDESNPAAAAHTVNGWASNISAGPANESGQMLQFHVTNDNNALFSVQPAIDASGNLTYTLAADKNGVANVTVTLQDNGGIANGGVDTTAPETFTITVTSVNDAPIAVDDNALVEEDNSVNIAVLANDKTGPITATDETTQTLIVTHLNGVAVNIGDSVATANGTVTLNADYTVTYEPNENYNGADSFSYTAQDSGAPPLSAVASGTVTINPINDKPVAVDGAVSTNEDNAGLAINLGEYVSDIETVDGDLVYTIDAGPNGAAGTLTQTGPNGHYTFVPSADFNGIATFTFHVRDGGDPVGTPSNELDSDTKTITITVTEVNDAPTATDDTYETDEDTALTVLAPGVLGNDAKGPSNESGQMLFATILDEPDHGTVTLQPDGSFIYTPDENYFGPDSFTYTVTDNGMTNGSADAKSDIGTVNLTVNEVNDAPKLTVDLGSVTIDEGQTASNSGTFDDVDLSDDVTITASKGSVTFTPNSNTGTWSWSYSGTDDEATNNVTITADDGRGGVETITFELTVNNVAPSVTSPGNQLANEAASTSFNLGSFTDPAGANDGPYLVTVNWGDGSPDTVFSVATPGSLGSQNHTYADNDSYLVTITVTEENGTGASGGATFSVAVANVVPTANDDTAAVNENGPAVVIDVLDNDTDPAGANDPLTITDVTASGSGALVTTDGVTVSYNPNGAFEYLAVGETATDTFTYTINDGDGGTATATVTVTITGQNDTPSVTVNSNSVTITEGDTATNSGTFNDVDLSDNVTITASKGTITQDPGNGGTWSWSYDGVDDEATHTVTITANDGNGGVAIVTFDLTVLNANPTLANIVATATVEAGVSTLTGNIIDAGVQDTFTLLVDWGDGSAPESFTYAAGTTSFSETHTYADDDADDQYTVTLTVTDDDSGTGGGSTTVAVTNLNPTANDDTANANEDGPAVTVDVLTNDTDPAGTTLDPLTIVSVTQGTNGGLVTTDGSIVTYNPNGAFEYLAVGETATDTFTYAISDGDGGTSTATVSVTITGQNDAPTVTVNSPSVTITEGSTATNSGTFDDVDLTDNVTITTSKGTITQAPGNSGTWSWSYDGVDDEATHTVTITANDGNGGIATTTFSLTVNNANPTLTNVAATATTEASSTTLTGTIADAGVNDTFTLVVDWGDGSAPEEFHYVAGTTSFSETHTYADDDADDQYTITLTLTDDDNGTATDSAVVIVTNLNPTANNDAAGANEDGPAVVVDVRTNDTDPAGTTLDPLTITTVTQGTAGGTVSHDGMAVTYNPDSAFEYLAVGETATDTFTYTITDSNGGTSVATVTFTITGQNDAPTVTVANSSVTINEGQTATNSGTFNDVDLTDDVTITASKGLITQDPGNSGTWSWSYDGVDDEAPHTVTITATDSHGVIAQTTFSLTVLNANPTLANIAATATVEAGVSTLTGNIIDPGVQDTFTLLVDWGDGSAPETFTYAAGTTSFSETHTYADDDADDSYTITLTVTDDNTGTGTGSTTVTVTNLNPTANADTTSANEDGPEVAIDVVTNDADPAGITLDPLSVIAVTQGTSGGSVTFTSSGVTYNPNGAFEYLAVGETAIDTFTYTISDGDGGTSVGSVTITVHGQNDGPSVTVNNASVTINEGQTATMGGMFDDLDLSDDVTITASKGTVTFTPNSNTGTWSWSYDGIDDEPPHTVTITATDPHSATAQVTFQLTVNNVAPILSNLSATATTETGTSTLTGTITDPGTADTFTVVVNWGDGSALQTFTFLAGTTSFSETHVYADVGSSRVDLQACKLEYSIVSPK